MYLRELFKLINNKLKRKHHGTNKGRPTMIFIFDHARMKEMAVLISQLVREGITWEVGRNTECFIVTITGGY